jgi:hypothetical protein
MDSAAGALHIRNPIAIRNPGALKQRRATVDVA